MIDANWDDLLRIGASLKQGYVSAALPISRLQAGSRQHLLAKAMLEYGKLLLTLHALRRLAVSAPRHPSQRRCVCGAGPSCCATSPRGSSASPSSPHLASVRIEGVPFIFSERIAGASKMTLCILLEGIRVTLALRRHHRPERRAGLPMAL